MIKISDCIDPIYPAHISITMFVVPDIAQRGETGSVRALMRSEDVQNRLLSINPMSMTTPYVLTAAF